MNQVAEDSVLDKVVHARLISNIDQIAQTAHVPVQMLHKSAKGFLAPEEVDWLSQFRVHQGDGKAGLCMMGKNQNAEVKMMAMCAALLRNFIDARVCTMASLTDESGDFSPPNPTVLLLPTLCVAFDGKPLATWQVQQVYSMLVERMASSRMTILYAVDFKTLRLQYGATLADFVQSNYTILDGTG